MSQKRIAVTKLKVGMYVCGFDQSWLQTPFFTHRFLLQDQAQIDKLVQSGIQEVSIDPSKGLDIEGDEEAPACATPTPASSATERDKVPPVAQEEPPPVPSAPPASKPPWMMGRELGTARQARQEMLQRVDVVFQSVSTSSTIQSEQVKDVIQDIMARTIDNEAAFLALVRTREFDPALRDHLLSVSTLALIVGKSLGYEAEKLEHLATGALLHDVGLLRLPHYMYRLPHVLKKGERSLYESHPHLGTTLLQRNGGFPQQVIQIVADHHETLASPERKQAANGRELSEASRLVMVLDKYDEMITGQHDPAPLSPHQALSRLYQDAQANRLDMELVSHLIRLLGVYPLYSLVELNTGERGIVTAVAPGKLHQPGLALFQDPTGQPYNPPILVDLSSGSSGGPIRSIVASLDAEQEGFRLEHVLSQLEPEAGTARASTTQVA
jgi:putative nucleotidyltransferase with HDIG domain